jgi:hypothetical protein
MRAICPARHRLAILSLCGCATLLLLGGCHQSTTSGADAPAAGKSAADHADAAKPDKSDTAKSDAAKPEAGGEESSEGVALKPDEVEKMGIAVTAAVATQHVPETTGFGVVTAHESIAQAVAEVVTAAATLRQSRAALARTQRLAGTPGAMPADAQEAAERQATVDQAAWLLAQQRLTANFGQRPPWKDDVDSPVLRALADGVTKLVRVTFPLGSLGTEAPARLQLAHLNAESSANSWTSTTLWSAPADPTVPGRSLFALLKGSDAGEGERLLVWAPVGAPESGVQIPAAAAVISSGKYWCYVERKPGVFVRTELDTSLPIAEGYFVKEGIAPGDKVVTNAAGLLLARETNPSTAAAD